MDLFCPHCTKRVSVPEDKAGQVMSCPLCAKQFMAPSLAPPLTAPKPPAPPPEATYGMSPAPPSPAPSVAPSSPAPSQPAPMSPPAPPPPPGEYSRSFVLHLNGTWLAFVPVGCLIAIFFLSFFTWHNIDRDHTPSLWGLSFVSQDLAEVKQAHFLAYTILMLFPTSILTIAALLLNKLPAPPPQVLVAKGWLDLAAGVLLALTFAMLCIDYMDVHVLQRSNPITVPLKLAIRLHFAAMLASFGMFWLYWRTRRNLPLPKVELRW